MDILTEVFLIYGLTSRLHVFRENFLVMDVYFAQLKRQKVRQLKAYEMKQFLGTSRTYDVTGSYFLL